MFTDEIIDEYDDDGRVVGTIKRSEAHATGAWHRVAAVFILNKQNKLLIQRRAATKTDCPNMWDISIVEHVSAGEDSRTAALRGIREELGLTVGDGELKNLFNVKEIFKSPKTFQCHIYDVFVVQKDTKPTDLKINNEEINEIKFVGTDEFIEMVDGGNADLCPHEEIYRQIKPILLHKLYV